MKKRRRKPEYPQKIAEDIPKETSFTNERQDAHVSNRMSQKTKYVVEKYL